jgi:hypothetical protein
MTHVLASGSFEAGSGAAYAAVVLGWFALSGLVGLVAARASGRAGWFTLYFVLSLVLSPLVGALACLAEMAIARGRHAA